MPYSQEPDFPAGYAVVFGGSGGLGRAIAEALVRHGSDVIVTYNARQEHADRFVEGARQEGRRAKALTCDVTDPASVQAVFEAAAAEGERVHTVISAVGLLYDVLPVATVSFDAFKTSLNTDVLGFFNITQAALPVLRDGGGGSITVLITAAIAKIIPNGALSAVPKSAVLRLVRQIAFEEGPNNIRVNAVGPGVIKAGQTLTVMESADKALFEYAAQQTPMRRHGEAEEFAEPVVFLASSRASFVTGQAINVDGGLSV